MWTLCNLWEKNSHCRFCIVWHLLGTNPLSVPGRFCNWATSKILSDICPSNKKWSKNCGTLFLILVSIVLKSTSTLYSKKELINHMLYVLRIPSKDFLFGISVIVEMAETANGSVLQIIWGVKHLTKRRVERHITILPGSRISLQKTFKLYQEASK